MKPKMHLAFDLSWAHMDGRWRTPGSWTGSILPDLTIYKEVASIAETEMTREEFFEHGMPYATAYDHAIAGPAAQVADFMEQEFEATGSRGGFMLAHPLSTPRDLLNVVDFLVPELRRRGRFRTQYESTMLNDNLRIAA